MKEKLRNSILLTILILSVSFLSGGIIVKADGSDYYYNDYGFKILEDGTASITEYIGSGGSIVLPSNVVDESGKTYKVSQIGEQPTSPSGAFTGCDTITSVTIPGTIETIDEGFVNCFNLKTVNIGYGVKSMISAFRGCGSLESVEVPGSIVSMSGAFDYCDNLKTAVIDSGVEIVGGFFGCDNLTDVVIPYGVKEIERSAFSYCENLTNITLPGEVEIDRTSFDGTFNIQTITIAEGSEKVSYNLNYIFDQAVSSANGTRKSLKTLNIPDSVTTMEDNIFERCTALTTINLSNNLTNLGKRQFYRCTSLTHITLPDSLITIDESAFSSCSLLAEINIPDSVIRIEDSAFASCYKLSNVTFGENLQSIGETAFFSLI